MALLLLNPARPGRMGLLLLAGLLLLNSKLALWRKLCENLLPRHF
jgi:hypothetical protein